MTLHRYFYASNIPVNYTDPKEKSLGFSTAMLTDACFLVKGGTISPLVMSVESLQC